MKKTCIRLLEVRWGNFVTPGHFRGNAGVTFPGLRVFRNTRLADWIIIGGYDLCLWPKVIRFSHIAPYVCYQLRGL